MKTGLIGKVVYEDEWVEIYVSAENKKTYVFGVHSKSSDCKLGIIQWYPSWRNYAFEPVTEYKIELSDRCQLAIGGFTMWVNAQHKMDYKWWKENVVDKK